MFEEPAQPTEADYAIGRLPGKVYFRPSPFHAAHVPGQEFNIGRVARFAYTVIVPEQDLRIERNGGYEVLIRETPRRRYQLKALFLEDDRDVKQLWIGRFTASGVPSKESQVILSGPEGRVFSAFLRAIESMPRPDGEGARADEDRSCR